MSLANVWMFALGQWHSGPRGWWWVLALVVLVIVAPLAVFMGRNGGKPRDHGPGNKPPRRLVRP